MQHANNHNCIFLCTMTAAHVSKFACECEYASVCVCLLKNHCFEHDSTEIIVEFALVLLLTPQPTITTTTTNNLIERKIFKCVWQHHRKRPKKNNSQVNRIVFVWCTQSCHTVHEIFTVKGIQLCANTLRSKSKVSKK